MTAPHDDDSEVELAIQICHDCRLYASRYEQMGFREIARVLRENADAAERWLAAGSQAKRDKIKIPLWCPTVVRFAIGRKSLAE